MLEGQWLGEDKGTNPGSLWVELDKIDGKIRGCGMRLEAEPNIPGTLVEVDLEDKAEAQSIEVVAQPLDTTHGMILLHEQARRALPDSTPAQRAFITIRSLDEKTMQVDWKSDIATEGSAQLKKASVGQTSRISGHPQITSWKDFKEEVLQSEYQNRLLRGQSKPWPLQTSFHRSHRSDLSRYIFNGTHELFLGY